MNQQNQYNGDLSNQQQNINDESKVYLEPYSVIDNSHSDQLSLDIDKTLKDLLEKDFKVIESQENKEKKENALLKLNEILKTWMQQVNQELNNPGDNEDSMARLLCFGSYKLGVSTPQGDIDAIVLAPNYVDREKHFFGILYNLLNEYSKYNENIKDLTFVNYTHSITPLIKLEFYDVQVDLLFANMDNVAQFDGQITESGVSIRKNLYNDFLMEHMDEKMKRSFNGFRNAEMILNSLIEGDDINDTQSIIRKIENYRNFLRCMKIFHKKKGIYENKFGYFGGITLALLTAKIFQLYPNYSCVQLIERFLYIYGYVWQWNDWKVYIVKQRPNPSEQKEPVIYQDNAINLEVGNFNDKKTRFIEVFTPAYPQMNSTYNVNYSTREVIVQCYRKYRDVIVDKIQQTISVQNDELKKKQIWQSFFDSEKFFQNYDQFMEFIIVGNQEELYIKWKGFIEAKIRMFCEKLEILMNNINFDMQIWPFTFQLNEVKKRIPYQDNLYQYKYSQKIYIGFKFHSDYSNEIDITGFLINFLQHLNYNWNSENHFRNSEIIDFYIFMVDKDDFYLDEQELQNEKDFNSMIDHQLNKRDSINYNINIEDNNKEILDELLD